MCIVRVSGGFLSGYPAKALLHKTTRWLLASCTTVFSSVGAAPLDVSCSSGAFMSWTEGDQSHPSFFHWELNTLYSLFPFPLYLSFALCFFSFTCLRSCMCVRVFFFPPISRRLHPKLRLCDAIRFSSRPCFCLLGTKCLRPEIAPFSLFPLSLSLLLPYFLCVSLSLSSHVSSLHLKYMPSYWAEVEIPAGTMAGAKRPMCLSVGPRLKAKG